MTAKTSAYICVWCDRLHPPMYECRVGEWKQFFNNAYPIITGSVETIDVEKMYQAFKLRLMHELIVPTTGELIERSQ